MKNGTFADKVLDFYNHLTLPDKLLPEVEVINPHVNQEAKKVLELFLQKYFNDSRSRVFVLGINPGRFGSGVTGVPFTDPIALEETCGIENSFVKKRELSSQFVYRFIEAWGGPKKFYSDFFLTAVSPVGFTRKGVNYNYYDDKEFIVLIKSFLLSTLKQQAAFGACDTCIVFGTDKNQKIFLELNKELGLFKKIYAIEHPRFIMQYKRKEIDFYLHKYNEIFTQALALV